MPVTFPGGKPVTAEPGLTPRLPVTTVLPVFVTVVPARTRKFAADPNGTGNWPQAFGADGLEVAPLAAAAPTLVPITVAPADVDAFGVRWVIPTTVDSNSTATAMTIKNGVVRLRSLLFRLNMYRLWV